jgi:hypothetical protein
LRALPCDQIRLQTKFGRCFRSHCPDFVSVYNCHIPYVSGNNITGRKILFSLHGLFLCDFARSKVGTKLQTHTSMTRKRWKGDFDAGTDIKVSNPRSYEGSIEILTTLKPAVCSTLKGLFSGFGTFFYILIHISYR